jgi:NADH-quinone oxidoreductase subunit G
MEYGNYDSEMAEKKVKKHKVVDLGERVVLDSERCILCSRCVRFTDEITGTKELGIFNRGDRSEIGTFEDRPLNNKYSVNVIDICPVGALTSKDFRFKQRVWYLKDGDSVCTGCSTGCNTKVYFNKEGVFRIKPRINKEVNGYWMCDEGRDLYNNFNRENRQLKALKKLNSGLEELVPGAAAKEIFKTPIGFF